MGAPVGNTNAAKAKRWTSAIEAAMAEMDKSRVDGLKTMHELAKALINEALAGEMAALKEIGDRLEGKPSQGVELTGANGGPVIIQASPIDEKL